MFKRGSSATESLNIGITSTHLPVKKVEVKAFVKDRLAHSKMWAEGSLLKIYDFQTTSEQKFQDTCEHNNVGFTGTDGKILSSLAENLKKYKRLTDKQMAIVYKKMPKYWKQIIKISDQEKLEKMVRQARLTS